MYKDTVTVFNRQRGRDGDVWYPTVLHGVNLNIDKGAILKQYGPESQDNAILNVKTGNMVVPEEQVVISVDGGTFSPWNITPPVKGGFFNPWKQEMMVSGGLFSDWGKVAFVSPKVWQSLKSKDGTFTFAPNDFIWKGEWTGGSPISDDNYGDLSFYDYMLAYYDFVYNVTTVGYFSVIPHIEVGAR